MTTAPSTGPATALTSAAMASASPVRQTAVEKTLLGMVDTRGFR
jgi:hypothetical protein